ncbi:MAG: lipopolysaccharide biosynthesis protein RfbH [Spirochaetes bacterium]|nr:lipopolysaccharide biosynthesis protein RfbH [Spirochaetota bacterium]
MEKILRSLVHASAGWYSLAVRKRHSAYLPPSGKVIGWNELRGMIDASLDGWLTTGRFNEEFEKRLASYIGVRYTLSVNSGSSANLLAVSALTSHKLKDRRLCEGDEVITVAAGFPTTVAPIIQNRMIPVFVDVSVGTYNAVVEHIEEAVSKKTKAIFLAHTLGNPFDIDGIRSIAKKHKLWLIEDNCDALGSEYKGRKTGTFGHIATCSFYPAHHITMGEGGAVLTDDPELYRIIMSMRDWGRDCWCPPGKDNTCSRRFEQKLGNLPTGYDHKYTYSHLGYNLKITDWQAAIGCAQLDRLPEFIRKRREHFTMLSDGLKKHDDVFVLPTATDGSSPSWFGFLLTLKDTAGFSKFDLVQHLEAKGVGTRQLFAGNMLRQPAFVYNEIPMRIRSSKLIASHRLSDKHYTLLPGTETIMNNTFWIGLWPGLNAQTIRSAIDALAGFIT